MSSFPDKWATAQQVRRVLHFDLRRVLTDVLLGFVFIFASYAISRANKLGKDTALSAPMLVTSLCIIYLNARLIAEETATETIQFFSNIPRGKMLTFWTRTIFVAIILLMYYLANIAGLEIKNTFYLNSFIEGKPFIIRSFSWSLPLVAFIASLWAMYLLHGQFERKMIIACCAFLIFPYLHISHMSSEDLGFVFPLFLFCAPFQVFKLAKRWKREQPGECL